MYQKPSTNEFRKPQTYQRKIYLFGLFKIVLFSEQPELRFRDANIELKERYHNAPRGLIPSSVNQRTNN